MKLMCWALAAAAAGAAPGWVVVVVTGVRCVLGASTAESWDGAVKPRLKPRLLESCWWCCCCCCCSCSEPPAWLISDRERLALGAIAPAGRWSGAAAQDEADYYVDGAAVERGMVLLKLLLPEAGSQQMRRLEELRMPAEQRRVG